MNLVHARTHAIGDAVKSPYIATLEDLAAKRRSLTDAIVALSIVEGVDPAEYLDRETEPEDDAEPEAEAVEQRRRPPIEPKAPTPRPSPPAPLATNGAGQTIEDRVLKALATGPRAPGVIEATTGLLHWKVTRTLKALIAAKRVLKTGTGPRNTKYQLA